MKVVVLTEDEYRNMNQELLLNIKKLLVKNEQPFPELLTTNEVCKMIRRSPGTLRSMREKGAIPFSRVGRGLLYKRQDVLDLLKGKKSTGLAGCLVYWFTTLYPLLQLGGE